MEKLQVFNSERQMLDEYVFRSNKDELSEGKYYMIILIFIENDGKFLVQKTSLKKNHVLAVTGGHVSYGDSSVQTVIKECVEELGLKLMERDIELVSSLIDDKCICDVYYSNKKVDIDSLVLQESEVESVMWLSFDEIEKLIENNDFRKGNIDAFYDIMKYKNGI